MKNSFHFLAQWSKWSSNMGDGRGKKKSVRYVSSVIQTKKVPPAFFLMLLFLKGFRESLGAAWACPLSVRGFKVPTLSRNSSLNKGVGISIVSTSVIELAGLPHRQLTQNFQNFVTKFLSENSVMFIVDDQGRAWIRMSSMLVALKLVLVFPMQAETSHVLALHRRLSILCARSLNVPVGIALKVKRM
jgi:hypothetical protein